MAKKGKWEEDMETSFEIQGSYLIIYLAGELDHHLADLIRMQCDTYLEGTRIKNVIFDFAHTTFMDSSGIGIIMGRFKQVARLGGSVYVVHVNPVIDRIIRMSGLYKIVKKSKDVESVLE